MFKFAIIQQHNPVIHGDIIPGKILNNKRYIVVYYVCSLIDHDLIDFIPDSRLAIVLPYTINGVELCVDKTHLIVNIQRKWKDRLRRLLNPRLLYRRSITGKYP